MVSRLSRLLTPLALAVALTASVFAIWPVVADAPWEDGDSASISETEPLPVGETSWFYIRDRDAEDLVQRFGTRLPRCSTVLQNRGVVPAPPGGPPIVEQSESNSVFSGGLRTTVRVAVECRP